MQRIAPGRLQPKNHVRVAFDRRHATQLKVQAHSQNENLMKDTKRLGACWKSSRAKAPWALVAAMFAAALCEIVCGARRAGCFGVGNDAPRARLGNADAGRRLAGRRPVNRTASLHCCAPACLVTVTLYLGSEFS